MKADAQTEAQVMVVMNQYNMAYAKRDVDGVMALFASDSNIAITESSSLGHKESGCDSAGKLHESGYAKSSIP